MKKLLSIMALLVILLAVTACPSGGEGHTPIPIEDWSLPAVGIEEVPDDIVSTPGGIAYRANVHQQGVENPWPPIESSEVVLKSGFTS
ncbi:unnamed protein product, partial [marine sediment metagenome]